MTKCQNPNCYNGKNCPITQEIHDLVKSQKRRQEANRIERCFKIIEHEIIYKEDRILLDKVHNSIRKYWV